MFFEEINHAGDGGLYAEMVKNRSFEAKEHLKGYRVEGNKLFPDSVPNHINGTINTADYQWSKDEIPGWSLDVDGYDKVKMKLTKANPLYTSTPISLRLDILSNQKVSLTNSGYSGMGILKGMQYNLRFYLRDSLYTGKMNVQFISPYGKVLQDKLMELNPNYR